MLIATVASTPSAWAGPSHLLPSEKDQKLQRALLAEILASDQQNDRKAVNKPSALTSGPSKVDHIEGVGSSVASVSTWPVLVLVVVLGGALVWFKKNGKFDRNTSGVITKLASVPLGAKRSLALVEVMGQKLVLGLSEKGLNLLARIDGDCVQPNREALSEGETDSDPFEEELRNLISKPASGFDDGSLASAEHFELARKFRNL
jgi:flagellar biogenesis protein FliO